jgi:hypothetical protein
MISIDPARIRRLLIPANNRIGNVVMISPAVRAIRNISALPGSRFSAASGGSMHPAANVAFDWKGNPCSPCRRKYFRECSPSSGDKPFCLEEIGVDEVEEAAVRLIPSIDRSGTRDAGRPQPPGESSRAE